MFGEVRGRQYAGVLVKEVSKMWDVCGNISLGLVSDEER